MYNQWGIPHLDLAKVRWTLKAGQLLALTLEYDLRATNGRCTSDRQGKATFNRPGHCSRIDYFLAQVELWPVIMDMEVIDRLDSDHNVLSLSLSIKKTEHIVDWAHSDIGELHPTNNLRTIKWEWVAKKSCKTNLY